LVWQTQRDAIGHLLARTAAFTRIQLVNSPALVLCHADIHTANLLLDGADRIHIVDWDETVLAPKERDLMFVTGSGIGFSVGPKEEQLFFKGYGATAVDRAALAYYRYGWAVEEIGDYSARVLGLLDGGDETKHAALEYLAQVFQPGGVVELAYQSDPANQ
jgi:spectinomycin phosphotransferase